MNKQANAWHKNMTCGSSAICRIDKSFFRKDIVDYINLVSLDNVQLDTYDAPYERHDEELVKKHQLNKHHIYVR